jgi:uncharacterized protein YecE (DUF72 family)
VTILVGPAGWSYEDWKGTVYPAGAGRDFDPLAYLAGYFDLVEVNSTFYRPPTVAATASWARRVRGRERFRFTVKVWKELTHGEAGAEEARSFRAALEPLVAENRLGALLLQFPFWFRDAPANRARIARLGEWLEDSVPRCVEVRHTSWLNREPMTFLNEHGLGFVNIDLPPGRGSPPPTDFATTPVGYVRLHGRNAAAWYSRGAGRDQKYDYLYSPAEVDDWTRRVARVAGKTRVTYVVTNNHFRGQAPATALQIMARIAGRKVPLPPALAERYPELRADGEPTEPGGPL